MNKDQCTGRRVWKKLKIPVYVAAIIGLVAFWLYYYGDPAVKPSIFASYVFVAVSLIPLLIFAYFLLAALRGNILSRIIVFTLILFYLGFNIVLFAIRKYCHDGITVELIQLISITGVPALLKFYLTTIIICSVFWLAFTSGITILLAKIAAKKARECERKQYWKVSILSLIVFALYTYQCNPNRGAYADLQFMKYSVINPEYFAKYGVKLTNIEMDDIVATPGKNLIYIILESTERNFLHNKQFPGLLPCLEQIHEESVSFENIVPAANATLTFGGIYASMTGTYLTRAHLRGEGVELPVGSKLGSLPKVLNKAGYRQHFLYAHNTWFRGFNAFLQQEHFNVYQINGRTTRLLSQDLFFDSMRDSFLYEKAWDHFLELAATGKPFNLALLTMDAHGPDGMYSPDEPPYPYNAGNYQILNAMYAGDYALAQFLRKLQRHPLWENTCVVIQSDHLMHHNVRSEILDSLGKRDERKLLFMIYNSAKESHCNQTEGMTFDIAPTILDAMEVRHNYTFLLGENLFEPVKPERLHYNDEQRNANQMAVLFASEYRSEATTLGIRFLEEPYPSVQIGGLNVPTYTADSLSNVVPKGEECFVVCFSEDMEIYKKICYFSCIDKMKAYIRKNDNRFCYLIFGNRQGGDINLFDLEFSDQPYFCILKKNEMIDLRQAAQFSELEIPPCDLKKFLDRR